MAYTTSGIKIYVKLNGPVKATVDGASVAATGTIVGGQLQINITDDYVKANSVITIDLSGVTLS